MSDITLTFEEYKEMTEALAWVQGTFDGLCNWAKTLNEETLKQALTDAAQETERARKVLQKAHGRTND